jgi:hypothetical protein
VQTVTNASTRAGVRSAFQHCAADSGLAGLGSLTQSFSGDPIEVVVVTGEPEPDFDGEWS